MEKNYGLQWTYDTIVFTLQAVTEVTFAVKHFLLKTNHVLMTIKTENIEILRSIKNRYGWR
jgi:hypothetical protein